MKLQCSVCWEDFTIDEKVMKLACDHMFHKDCITPWLELVSFFFFILVFVTTADCDKVDWRLAVYQ